MSYVTPVTDRSATDIANQTSKAFWNVADFERVYGNSLLVHSLIVIYAGATSLIFNQLAMPTITTIPTVADFNTFLANIERARQAFVDDEAVIPGVTTEIKDDYTGGAQGTSPKFTDANLWESTLDAIWEYYDGASLPVCPTLAADLTVLTGTNAIYVDCIDAANFNIDLQGTANLYII